MTKVLILTILTILLLINGHHKAYAQEAKPQKDFEMGLEGMIGVAFNPHTVAVTIGGSYLKFKVRPNLAVGVAGFPSLLYSTNVIAGNNETRVTKFEPKLGLSPRIDYKRLIIFAPAYHFSNPNQWLWCLGVGYKFH